MQDGSKMSEEERRLELEKPWNPPGNKADWTPEIWDQFRRRLNAKYTSYSDLDDFGITIIEKAKPQTPEGCKEGDQ